MVETRVESSLSEGSVGGRLACSRPGVSMLPCRPVAWRKAPFACHWAVVVARLGTAAGWTSSNGRDDVRTA